MPTWTSRSGGAGARSFVLELKKGALPGASPFPFFWRFFWCLPVPFLRSRRRSRGRLGFPRSPFRFCGRLRFAFPRRFRSAPVPGCSVFRSGPFPSGWFGPALSVVAVARSPLSRLSVPSAVASPPAVPPAWSPSGSRRRCFACPPVPSFRRPAVGLLLLWFRCAEPGLVRCPCCPKQHPNHSGLSVFCQVVFVPFLSLSPAKSMLCFSCGCSALKR